MKYIKLRFVILSTLLLTGMTFGATVSMHAIYGKTGGLAGNLNKIGDKINGRDICPDANTNANGTAGCDMSNNPGLNDNGTPLKLNDDYYTGDMIVRTNDSFEAIAAYHWNGNAGGTEEKVTITGELPGGAGFVWDGIPGSCVLPDSTLSADKKTIICVKKDFDTKDVGDYSEDMPFAVKVEGNAVNGSKPGYISFTIDTPNGDAQTDTTQTDKEGDDDEIIVTASPRWNIDKHGSTGHYALSFDQIDPNTNEHGFVIWYNFLIELDEVPDEDDTADSILLGNEQLAGGDDATVNFTDELSQISPNAKLATWMPGGACDMTHSNSSIKPYATFNTAYPDRSVAAPKGPLAITCTQQGSAVSVKVEHMDSTLKSAPIKTQTGSSLPVNRKIAAIGTIRVFVPISDVKDATNGELMTKNCIKDFAPKGASGTDNFNGAGESTKDNCRNLLLKANAGAASKLFVKGWSDSPTQATQWGGGTWRDLAPEASGDYAGDGIVTPDTLWGTYTFFSNNGGDSIKDALLCDVIDINTYEMVILNTTDDPSTALDETQHAVDINAGPTETLPGIGVQYAVGYKGTWPPNPDESPKYAVANECNATDITWYDTYTAAKVAADDAGTGVSKVRIFADEIPPNKYMALRIKHKARSVDLQGNPIPSNTLLVNYMAYKSSLSKGNYNFNSYRPHNASRLHESAGAGDRVILQRAKVRIGKKMTPSNVSIGSEITVTLTPSFTVDGANPQSDTVMIADLLPKGLAYKKGTTVGSYTGGILYGEPTVISSATDAQCHQYAATLIADGKPCGTLNGGTGKESIVYWDLGQQNTGTVYGDINFTTIVTIETPSGILKNYVQIESPSDLSKPGKRIANANVNVSVPASLLMSKSVLRPLYSINKGSLSNWMEFQLQIRNGSVEGLTDLDVIDLLPFNGDGNIDSITFSPSSDKKISLKRTPGTVYHGVFQFDSMSFDENGECDASQIEYWYTKKTGTLDISPAGVANNIEGTNINEWCQGTATGPNASCGFTNANVTAVRIRKVDMSASGLCSMKVKFATKDNWDEDIYSNTASAKATGVTNAVLSNTVSTKVYASSLGDTVWFDKNKNGLQDNDESGLENVTVKLYNSSMNKLDGNILATTKTNENGKYIFPNLLSGSYQVKVVPLAGYTATTQLSGDNSLDSNINPSTYATDSILLGENEDKRDIDAGLILVTDANTTDENTTDENTTDENTTDENTTDENTTDENTTDENMTNTNPVVNAHMGDYFWIDKNANGVQETGEKPVVGATIELFDAQGHPLTDIHGNHSVTTDANGKYGFDVDPGTYQVKFNLPKTGYEGYVFSNASQGDDKADTDVNRQGFTQKITVAAGDNIVTLDAGINCGCANVSTDSADTQSLVSMLAMMFFTLMTVLYFARKEEEQNI